VAHALRRFGQLSGPERLMLAEAFFWLALARAAVVLLPFRWIAPRLGEVNRETPDELSPAEMALARRTGGMVRRASRYTFWQSNCLAQAIAAAIMLRRRRVATTLYLGVMLREKRLEAHAWLRGGAEILTGAAGRQRFRVISTIASRRVGEP
jgi:hypothetical protein